MLEAHGLRKKYGHLVAVDDVSFVVEAGTCVGLLGPNGAGKTTTVSMIAGLMPPDAGEVRIHGEPLTGDADPRKKRIGLVPQDIALYDELRADDNLSFFGALYDLPPAQLSSAVATALEFVGLADRARDRVRTYSGGMKRRLNVAAALLHDPDLLILDEPTVGVDPQSRSAIFDNLLALKARGKAVLYTTHYMEEAERLCDRIVIMDRGLVVADDTLRGLAKRMPARRRVAFELEPTPEPPPALVDRQRGLWKRLRAAPLSRGTLLLSKVLSGAINALLILGWLFLFGRFTMGVKISGSVPGFVLVAVSFALMASTLGVLVSTLGKMPQATRSVGIFVVLVAVMLGGAWFPSFLFPEWLQTVSRFVPTRWAVDGLDAMTWRGLGMEAALLPTAVLLGSAALFGALAMLRFRWDE